MPVQPLLDLREAAGDVAALLFVEEAVDTPGSVLVVKRGNADTDELRARNAKHRRLRRG